MGWAWRSFLPNLGRSTGIQFIARRTGRQRRWARRLPSRARRPQLLSPAAQRTVFDAEEGTRPEVGSRGLANLACGDPGDPLGPVLRLVEAQAKALQLQQPFGALIDGLEIEDVGAGQV